MNKLFWLFLVLPFSVRAQNEKVKVLSPAGRAAVGCWETVEIGVAIPLPAIQSEGPGNSVDPFSRQVTAEFSCHGKKYAAEGFYYEAAKKVEARNAYFPAPAKYNWRIRFAPPDTGTWTCTVTQAMPKNESLIFPPVQFRCVASDRHGFLQVAADQQHFQFSDSTAFFALGQNIAWADEPVAKGHDGPPPVYSAGFDDILHYISHLGESGGNYVRIIMTPWSTGIEWKQAGRYAQDRAFIMDSILKICEEKNIYIHLCLEMQSGYAENYSPAEYSWKSNPYRALLNDPSNVSEVFTNPKTVALFKQRYRYIHDRWGYSPHIAVYELLSEMNYFDGYKEHQQTFIGFHRAMAKYFREELHDPHVFTTCFGTPPYGKMFATEGIETTSMHHYGNNRTTDVDRYNHINGRNLLTAEKRGMRQRWNKPTIFGEMGMITGPVNAADPDDIEHCSDQTFHNALWATAFMGGFGAGLNWWQWKNDAYRAANFPAIDSFFTRVNPALLSYTEPRMAQKGLLEAFYSTSPTESGAIGWIHNTSDWWGNTFQACSDRSGKKMLLPKDDDKAEKPVPSAGMKIELGGFARNKAYAVMLFDTRGKGQTLQSEVTMSDRRGRITITVPEGSDWSFRITRTQQAF